MRVVLNVENAPEFFLHVLKDCVETKQLLLKIGGHSSSPCFLKPLG